MDAATSADIVGMENTHADRLLNAARALRSTLVTMVTQVDDLCDLIESAVPRAHLSLIVAPGAEGQQLRVERTTYSVQWHERRCVLGNTTGFALLEQLARRPNEYVTIDRLLDDLWANARTYSTVRSTVCRLKAKLREADMADLAALIDGSMYGHYALMLRRS